MGISSQDHLPNPSLQTDALLRKYMADSAHLYQDYAGELPISTIGSTIGTHVGPGAIALAYFSKT